MPVTVSAANDAGTGTLTIAEPKFYTVEPGAYGSSPDHARYVVFEVTAVGVTDTFEVNDLFEFDAKTPNGSVYTPALTTAWDQVPLEPLGPGERVHGYVVFDLPLGAATLRYTSTAYPAHAATKWNFVVPTTAGTGTTAPSGANPGSSSVWMWAPLSPGLPLSVHVHPSTNIYSGNLATVSGSVAIVCRVAGPSVSTTYFGAPASSSNWDYVTYPVSGWVADVFLDTRTSSAPNGAIAPRC